MLKRIRAALAVSAAAALAVIAVSMAGCSKNYTMTEEDLELQRSMVGFWAADNTTGYNAFDEDGNLEMVVIVQFTDDFNYLLYNCYPNSDGRYVMTYEPISYSIEDGKFKVDNGNKVSYAGVSISSDGDTLSWINDDKTDIYRRVSDEIVVSLNIPEYNAESWQSIKEAREAGESGVPENTEAVSESETQVVESENEE